MGMKLALYLKKLNPKKYHIRIPPYLQTNDQFAQVRNSPLENQLTILSVQLFFHGFRGHWHDYQILKTRISWEAQDV